MLKPMSEDFFGESFVVQDYNNDGGEVNELGKGRGMGQGVPKKESPASDHRIRS